MSGLSNSLQIGDLSQSNGLQTNVSPQASSPLVSTRGESLTDLGLQILSLVPIIEEFVNSKNASKIIKLKDDLTTIANKLTGSSENIPQTTSEIIIEKLNTIESNINKTGILQHPRSKPRARKPKNNAVIIKSTSPSITSTEVGNKIKTLLSVNKDIVCEAVVVNDLSTRIITESKETLECISSLITNSEYKNDVVIEPLKLLDPQISFIVETDQLEDAGAVKHRNRIPDSESFEFVYTNEIRTRAKTKKTYVVARMSKGAREYLESRGKIYCGLQAIRFKDNFNVRTCSSCLRIGHTAKYCSNSPKCGKCREEHTTTSCNNQNNLNTDCLYCQHSGSLEVKHKPKSEKCFAYNQAIERVKQITNYDYDDDL